MLKPGQIIMYRRSVCEVKDVLKKFRDNKDYYKLAPIYDDTLLINAPVEGFDELYRPILTRSEAEGLIDNIPEVDCAEIENERVVEAVYKNLYDTQKHEDLVKIIKTTYLRAEEKLEKGQKRSEKDKLYFRKAEEALYGELAVSLGLSVEQTRDYVVDRVATLAV